MHADGKVLHRFCDGKGDKLGGAYAHAPLVHDAGLNCDEDHATNSSLLPAYVAFVFAIMAVPMGGKSYLPPLVCAPLLVATWLQPVRYRIPWGLCGFLLWCMASTFWSVAPMATIRGVVAVASVTVAATFAVQCLGVTRTLLACALGAKVVLVLSWTAYVVDPVAGRTQQAYQNGAFEGVFQERNGAAFASVIFFILFIFETQIRQRLVGRVLAAAWAGLAAATILMAQSSTGLAMLGLAAFLTWQLSRLPRRGPVGRKIAIAIGVAILGTTASWASFNLSTISELLGRDSTLTGRTVVWDVVTRHVSDVLLGGFGWSSLWQAGVPTTERLWSEGGFRFPHAHEAYLEYLIQVGLVNLVIILVLMLGTVAYVLRHATTLAPSEVVFVPSVLITMLFYAVTEIAFASNVGLFMLALCAGSMYATEPCAERGQTSARHGSGPGAAVTGEGSHRGASQGLVHQPDPQDLRSSEGVSWALRSVRRRFG